MANQNHDNISTASHDKPWERPWSTDEVRQNAHTWNLAGDSGLLRHLQELSQNVLARTHSSGRALDSLIEDINTTAAEINIVNNRFLCLANTQFVENRVYEEDDGDVTQNVPPVEEKPKEETEAMVLQKVKQALSMSVAVLDTMFDPVEIQASDSDGESSSDKPRTTALLLEPHNPYLNRPLPYLIGSDAFMSDDKIGLEDSPSDAEEKPFGAVTLQDVEESSESEADFTLPDNKRDRDAYSSVSSASESGTQSHQTKKVKSYEHSGSIKIQEAEVHSTLSDDPKTEFAQQLAAKLGHMATNLEPSDVKDSNPIKNHSDDLFGSHLLDEDEEEDALFKGSSGLFSDRPKLFDDLEYSNSFLWGASSSSKNSDSSQALPRSVENFRNPSQDLFDRNEDEEDLFSVKHKKAELSGKDVVSEVFKSTSKKNERNISSGDFTPDATGTSSTPLKSGQLPSSKSLTFKEQDVPTLSASIKVLLPNTTTEQPNPTISPQKENTNHQEKKPTGGVLLFGQASLLPGLKDKLPRRPPSASSSSASESENQDKGFTSQSEDLPHNMDRSARSEIPSSGGVVDSSSSQFTFNSPCLTSTRQTADDGYQSQHRISEPFERNSQNLFEDSSVITPKTSSISAGLFADIEDTEDDLFSGPPFSNKPLSSDYKVSSSIFPDTDDQEDLFANPKGGSYTDGNQISFNASSTENSKKDSHSPKTDPASFSVGSSSNVLPSKQDELSRNSKLGEQKTDIFSSVPPPLKSDLRVKTVSLFDESDSGDDDLLFSSASSAGSRRSQASSDLLSTSAVSSIEKKPLSKKSLFDDDDALFGSTDVDPHVNIFCDPTKVRVQPQTPPKSDPETKVEGDVSSNSVSRNLEVQGKYLEKQNLVSKHVSDSKKIPLTSQSDENQSLFPIDDPHSTKITGKLPQVSFLGTNETPSKENLFRRISQHNTEGNLDLSSKLEDGVLASTHKQEVRKINCENINDPEKFDGINPGTVVQVPSASLKDHLKQSVLGKPKKPEPPKTLDIRNETDPSLSFMGDFDDDDDDDDLFIKSTVKSSLTNDNSFPEDSIICSDTLSKKPLLPSKPLDACRFSSKSDTKEVKHQVLQSKVNSSEVDGACSTFKKVVYSSPSVAPGSIQTSLKIDPLALLPGAKPPSKRPVNKESSPEEVSDAISTRSVSSETSQFSLSSDSIIGFDQPIVNSATLPSAHKDRAKLGSKRRPPSSKARREAARANRSFDDKSETESPLSPFTIDSSLLEKESKITCSPSNTILSPSTDEDDMFGVPQDLPPEYGKHSIPTADIFGGAPVLSPSGVPSASSDQLFSSSTKDFIPAASLPHKSQHSPELNQKSLPSLLKGSDSSNSLFPVVNTQTNGKEKDPQQVLNLPSSIAPQDEVLTSLDGVNSKQSLNPSPDTESRQSNKSVIPSSDVKQKPVLPTPVGIDPLIDAQHDVSSDDPLFPSEEIDSNDDHHNSLFPFVKKVPSFKDVQTKPLFSRAPSLPSKDDNTDLKPNCESPGIDSGLFSASDNLQGKSAEGASDMLSNSGKIWQLSDDENDDDLFSSGSKMPQKIQKDMHTVDTNVSKDIPKTGIPAEQHPEPKKPERKVADSLFEDCEENEENVNDLFSKSSVFSKKSNTSLLKTSLFDEDDDDLFGPTLVSPQSSAKGYQTSVSSSSQRAGPMLSTLTKLKPETTFDDPLMAMNRDE